MCLDMHKLLRLSVVHPRFVTAFLVIILFLTFIYWWITGSNICTENEYREFKEIRQHHRLLLARVEEMKNEVRKLQAAKKKQLQSQEKDNNIPIIYCITPTYARYTQKADLTRLSQTLMHMTRLHWVIVEDSEQKTQLVEDLLRESSIAYTHLAVKTQHDLVKRSNDPRWKKHRGVDQRNAGLRWLRNHVTDRKGVVYFADDDNTYHIKLFEEMRWTKSVSMWPVALVGGILWEGPICTDGKIVAFYTAWEPQRKFPVDMASFAINIGWIFDANDVYINPEVRRGHLESDFLMRLGIARDDVEAKADNCKKILVWHTQTAEPNLKLEKKLRLMGQGSDPSIEV